MKTECPNIKDQKICEKHGPYNAYWKSFSGKLLDSPGCPKCIEKEREVQKNRDALYELNERIKEAHLYSNVPKRFRGLDIDKIDVSYHKNKDDNKKLRHTVETVKRYLNTYDERSKIGASGFFSGECGTGKTMLACMMVEGIINKGHLAQYVTAWQMIQEIRKGYNNAIEEDILCFIKQYIQKSFLVIDEIGVQHGTEDERILLYQVIDGRYNDVKPTVLISNSKNPVEDGYLDFRTIDRLKEGGGFSITFTGESYRH